MYQTEPILGESSRHNVELSLNAIDTLDAEYKVKFAKLERERLETLQACKHNSESELVHKQRSQVIEEEFRSKRNDLDYDHNLQTQKYQRNVRYFQMEDQFLNGKQIYNDALERLPGLQKQMNYHDDNRLLRFLVSILTVTYIGFTIFYFDYGPTVSIIYVSINGVVYFCFLVCIMGSSGHHLFISCETSLYEQNSWTQYLLLLGCGFSLPLFGVILFMFWAFNNPYSNDVKRYQIFVKWYLKTAKQMERGIDLFETNLNFDSETDSETEESSLV